MSLAGIPWDIRAFFSIQMWECPLKALTLHVPHGRNIASRFACLIYWARYQTRDLVSTFRKIARNILVRNTTTNVFHLNKYEINKLCTPRQAKCFPRHNAYRQFRRVSRQNKIYILLRLLQVKCRWGKYCPNMISRHIVSPEYNREYILFASKVAQSFQRGIYFQIVNERSSRVSFAVIPQKKTAESVRVRKLKMKYGTRERGTSSSRTGYCICLRNIAQGGIYASAE